MSATLQIRPDLCTMLGRIHGGTLMAMADSVGAAATIINLPEGAGTTTLESKTNFLASADEGTTLTAEGEVLAVRVADDWKNPS